MELANPFRSLIPTVDADVLDVLTRTHAPLTGARVQRLAGRSYAQVTAVLHRLVEHGLVDAERHGSAVSYRLNRDHVLADVIGMASRAVDEVERRIVDAVAGWRPEPEAVVLFGSAARRTGDAHGDIDVLVVRPEAVADDDEQWVAQRHELAARIQRWTGNSCQLVELSAGELADAVRRGDQLIAELSRDGRSLSGPDVKVITTGKRNAEESR